MSGSKKARLKLADFDWVKKCTDIAQKTDGMSGRQLSKLVIGWQVAKLKYKNMCQCNYYNRRMLWLRVKIL